MKGSMAPYKERLLRERKKWKRWQKVVSVMGALVVFCTAYALILPAVTMGKETYCGQEEHQHNEDCYLLVRRGAATPGNAVPVDPEDLLATPSDAEESNPEISEPGLKDDKEATESGETATPGNAKKSDEAGSGPVSLFQAEMSQIKQLISEVKESNYRVHSASNSSLWEKEETKKDTGTDRDEDEWFAEDVDLINDLEPEEEFEDYLPYEFEMEYDEELYILIIIEPYLPLYG